MGWQQQLGVGVGPLQPHFLSPNPTAHKPVNTPASLPLSSTKTCNYTPRLRAISLQQLPPNALSRKRDPSWRGGFSLGVDLGMSRTGLALSKGFPIHPLTVMFCISLQIPLFLLRIVKIKKWTTFFFFYWNLRSWNYEDKSLSLSFFRLHNRRYIYKILLLNGHFI